MNYPQSFFGFGTPELFILIMIGVIAAIIYATISAFRKGYSGDSKDKNN